MTKTAADLEATARIEAALYSSGRPLKIEELVKASGTESRARTVALLMQVIRRTRTAFTALELAELPDNTYVFQLKPEYSRYVRKYASKPLISKAALKTLSYIAREQPISSKMVVEVRGTGAYSHFKELSQLDFIRHEKVGRLKMYSTTEKFQKYFGIQGDADALKRALFKRAKKTKPSSSQE